MEWTGLSSQDGTDANDLNNNLTDNTIGPTRISQSSNSSNDFDLDQLVSIDIGDTVQLLEEFVVAEEPGFSNQPQFSVVTSSVLSPSSTSGGVPMGSMANPNKSLPANMAVTSSKIMGHNKFKKAKWLRGYVFQTSKSSHSTPKLGVFPASHIHSRGLVLYYISKEKLDLTPTPSNFATLNSGDATKTVGSLGGDQETYKPTFVTKTSSSNPIPPPVKPTLETAAGIKEPLADEIAAALREWGSLLKDYLMSYNYSLFSTVKLLFHNLHQGRRQLLSPTLTVDERIQLRRSLVAQLELGNRLQGLDLIIRHPEKGHLVGEKSLVIVKSLRLYLEYSDKIGRLQQPHTQNKTNEDIASLLSAYAPLTNPLIHPATQKPLGNSNGLKYLSGESSSWAKQLGEDFGSIFSNNSFPALSKSLFNMDAFPLSTLSSSKSYNLFLEVTSCTASICLPGEYAELSFFIYNKRNCRPITEDFVIVIDYNGNPRSSGDDGVGGVARLRTIFKDLSLSDDLLNSTVLVCKIVRVGKMNVSDKDNSVSNSSGSSSTFGGILKSRNLRSSPSLSSLTNITSLSMQSSAVIGNNENLNTFKYRRPFGCGVVDLQEFWAFAASLGLLPTAPSGISQNNVIPPANHTLMMEGLDVTHLTGREFMIKLYIPTQDIHFSNIHDLILNRMSSGFEPSTRTDQLTVKLQLLNLLQNGSSGVNIVNVANDQLHSDSTAIIKNGNMKLNVSMQDKSLNSSYTTSASGTATSNLSTSSVHPSDFTPRIGLPDIVYPGEARNSMYLTLLSGDFAGRSTALSARNIQVSIVVRTAEGEFVENCLSRGMGYFESCYESVVYYHCNV